MRLILARHGRTFKDTQKPVMIGVGQDMPLTDAGMQQARAFGQMLAARSIDPAAVYCSTLQRTREFARAAIEETKLRIKVQQTGVLNEIDYGLWCGKTDEEIIREFGSEPLRAWQEKSQWPQGAGWRPGEKELEILATEFAGHLVSQWPRETSVILVGSSGVLRYFLKLVPGEWGKRIKAKSFKINPGNYGEITHREGKWECLKWNEKPE
ncbi:MAG: histidine phosphatase family protein [Elusimicrobia bacterium]|nr:histidine phosphatase family protein [Elusimicrobiota bacterium]